MAYVRRWPGGSWRQSARALLTAGAVFSAGFLAARSAAASTILETTEDAYISEASKDAEFLDTAKLYTAGFDKDVNNVYKTYVKFDLTGIDKQLILAAELLLTVDIGYGNLAEDKSTFTVFGIKTEEVEDWAEGADPFTWNTAVGTMAPQFLDGHANDDDNKLRSQHVQKLDSFDILGKGTDLVGTQIGISGQALLDFLLLDTNNSVSFIITRSAPPAPKKKGKDDPPQPNYDYVHAFVASESSTYPDGGPILRLDLAPEPTSIVLMGSGLAGLWFRARRRRTPAREA